MNEFKTFTSFTVNDIAEARKFYTSNLGLEEHNQEVDNVLMFQTGGDTSFMIYGKEDHSPAGYTVLNFAVSDIDSSVDKLNSQGIKFEQLEGTNDKCIAEMGGVKAAWFKDPAGNWLGLFQWSE